LAGRCAFEAFVVPIRAIGEIGGQAVSIRYSK
jgi:hypothetical protein